MLRLQNITHCFQSNVLLTCFIYAGLLLVTAELIEFSAFQDMTPCGLCIDIDILGGTCGHHFQVSSSGRELAKR
jgi:hypothetical protein